MYTSTANGGVTRLPLVQAQVLGVTAEYNICLNLYSLFGVVKIYIYARLKTELFGACLSRNAMTPVRR